MKKTNGGENPLRILVVEDEKRLADTLCELLTYHSYLVDAAYNGETGLDNALTGIYDAVILDVMMPKKKRLSGGKRAAGGGAQYPGAPAYRQIRNL